MMNTTNAPIFQDEVAQQTWRATGGTRNLPGGEHRGGERATGDASSNNARVGRHRRMRREAETSRGRVNDAAVVEGHSTGQSQRSREGVEDRHAQRVRGQQRERESDTMTRWHNFSGRQAAQREVSVIASRAIAVREHARWVAAERVRARSLRLTGATEQEAESHNRQMHALNGNTEPVGKKNFVRRSVMRHDGETGAQVPDRMKMKRKGPGGRSLKAAHDMVQALTDQVQAEQGAQDAQREREKEARRIEAEARATAEVEAERVAAQAEQLAIEKQVTDRSVSVALGRQRVSMDESWRRFVCTLPAENSVADWVVTDIPEKLPFTFTSREYLRVEFSEVIAWTADGRLPVVQRNYTLDGEVTYWLVFLCEQFQSGCFPFYCEESRKKFEVRIAFNSLRQLLDGRYFGPSYKQNYDAVKSFMSHEHNLFVSASSLVDPAKHDYVLAALGSLSYQFSPVSWMDLLTSTVCREWYRDLYTIYHVDRPAAAGVYPLGWVNSCGEVFPGWSLGKSPEEIEAAVRAEIEGSCYIKIRGGRVHEGWEMKECKLLPHADPYMVMFFPQRKNGNNLRLGAVKRIIRKKLPAGPELLGKYRQFTNLLLEKVATVAEVPESYEHLCEEHVRGTQYSEADKLQFVNVGRLVDTFVRGNQPVATFSTILNSQLGAFVKQECYDAEKPPRYIVNPSIQLRALGFCLVHPVEAALEKDPYFSKFLVKGLTAHEIRAKLMHAMEGRGNVAETDFTSMESNLRSETLLSCEGALFVAKSPDNVKTLCAEYFKRMAERAVFENPQFTIHADPMRWSGTPQTSIGNALFNFSTVMLALSSACGRTMEDILDQPPAALFEGDDGIFELACSKVLFEDAAKELGVRLKVDVFQRYTEAGFCGNHLAVLHDVPYVVKNPVEILMKAWVTMDRMCMDTNAHDLTLLVAKSFSLLYQYPGMPIVSVYASEIIRKYRIDADKVFAALQETTGHLPYEFYIREKFRSADRAALLNSGSALFAAPIIPDSLRVVFEAEFGITVAQQKLLEDEIRRQIPNGTALDLAVLHERYHVAKSEVRTFRDLRADVKCSVDAEIRAKVCDQLEGAPNWIIVTIAALSSGTVLYWLLHVFLAWLLIMRFCGFWLLWTTLTIDVATVLVWGCGLTTWRVGVGSWPRMGILALAVLLCWALLGVRVLRALRRVSFRVAGSQSGRLRLLDSDDVVCREDVTRPRMVAESESLVAGASASEFPSLPAPTAPPLAETSAAGALGAGLDTSR